MSMTGVGDFPPNTAGPQVSLSDESIARLCQHMKKMGMGIDPFRARSPITDGCLVDVPTVDNGIIRLSVWDGVYVLWYHGEIVWKSKK